MQSMLAEATSSVRRLRGEDSVETSTIGKSYCDWRDAVDQRLKQIYCITIEDAGIDEASLISHWRTNEDTFDFVEWFGNKYDLDPIVSLVRIHERRR
jgi:hypothetical protein